MASSGVHLPHNSNPLRATAVGRDVSNAGRLERKTSAPQNDETSTATKQGRTANSCSNLPTTSSFNVTVCKYSTRENSETVPDGSAVKNTGGW